MRAFICLFFAFFSMISLAADQTPLAVPATVSATQAPSSPAAQATSAPGPATAPDVAPSAQATPVPNNASAPLKAESVGQVIWAKGQVSATLPNQEKRVLTRKAPIYREDVVESDKSSSAQINLTDGTLLAITANTKMQLEKYNFDKQDASQDSYVMNVAKGGLRTITGEIGKKNPEATQTKTPIVTLAALGTDFSVIVKKNTDTFIAVKKGRIRAKNNKGKTIELGAFDQRYAMINAANQEIAILKKMPAEFDSLNTLNVQNKQFERITPRRGGGFCVGQ